MTLEWKPVPPGFGYGTDGKLAPSKAAFVEPSRYAVLPNGHHVAVSRTFEGQEFEAIRGLVKHFAASFSTCFPDEVRFDERSEWSGDNKSYNVVHMPSVDWRNAIAAFKAGGDDGLRAWLTGPAVSNPTPPVAEAKPVALEWKPLTPESKCTIESYRTTRVNSYARLPCGEDVFVYTKDVGVLKDCLIGAAANPGFSSGDSHRWCAKLHAGLGCRRPVHKRLRDAYLKDPNADLVALLMRPDLLTMDEAPVQKEAAVEPGPESIRGWQKAVGYRLHCDGKVIRKALPAEANFNADMFANTSLGPVFTTDKAMTDAAVVRHIISPRREGAYGLSRYDDPTLGGIMWTTPAIHEFIVANPTVEALEALLATLPGEMAPVMRAAEPKPTETPCVIVGQWEKGSSSVGFFELDGRWVGAEVSDAELATRKGVRAGSSAWFYLNTPAGVVVVLGGSPPCEDTNFALLKRIRGGRWTERSVVCASMSWASGCHHREGMMMPATLARLQELAKQHTDEEMLSLFRGDDITGWGTSSVDKKGEVKPVESPKAEPSAATWKAITSGPYAGWRGTMRTDGTALYVHCLPGEEEAQVFQCLKGARLWSRDIDAKVTRGTVEAPLGLRKGLSYFDALSMSAQAWTTGFSVADSAVKAYVMSLLLGASAEKLSASEVDTSKFIGPGTGAVTPPTGFMEQLVKEAMKPSVGQMNLAQKMAAVKWKRAGEDVTLTTPFGDVFVPSGLIGSTQGDYMRPFDCIYRAANGDKGWVFSASPRIHVIINRIVQTAPSEESAKEAMAELFLCADQTLAQWEEFERVLMSKDVEEAIKRAKDALGGTMTPEQVRAVIDTTMAGAKEETVEEEGERGERIWDWPQDGETAYLDKRGNIQLYQGDSRYLKATPLRMWDDDENAFLNTPFGFVMIGAENIDEGDVESSLVSVFEENPDASFGLPANRLSMGDNTYPFAFLAQDHQTRAQMQYRLWLLYHHAWKADGVRGMERVSRAANAYCEDDDHARWERVLQMYTTPEERAWMTGKTLASMTEGKGTTMDTNEMTVEQLEAALATKKAQLEVVAAMGQSVEEPSALRKAASKVADKAKERGEEVALRLAARNATRMTHTALVASLAALGVHSDVVTKFNEYLATERGMHLLGLAAGVGIEAIPGEHPRLDRLAVELQISNSVELVDPVIEAALTPLIELLMNLSRLVGEDRAEIAVAQMVAPLQKFRLTDAPVVPAPAVAAQPKAEPAEDAHEPVRLGINGAAKAAVS